MIGIGVIGAGYWGPNLMRNFAVLEDCRLRSVCDLSQERLASVERNHPGVAVTGSLQDILEDDEIQGVAIATSVHLRLRRTWATLQASSTPLGSSSSPSEPATC